MTSSNIYDLVVFTIEVKIKKQYGEETPSENQIVELLDLTFENFKIIFQDPYYLHEKLLNSTLIAFFTVIIAIPLATMAAYSFSRFRLKGERIMFVTILATQFVPAVVIVLPFFILFRDLGILDTRLALVLVNLSLIMPFAIWMIKGFMDSIPIETEEAAMVDGSSRIQVIINVVVPMALPGVIIAAIFCFIPVSYTHLTLPTKA